MDPGTFPSSNARPHAPDEGQEEQPEAVCEYQPQGHAPIHQAKAVHMARVAAQKPDRQKTITKTAEPLRPTREHTDPALHHVEANDLQLGRFTPPLHLVRCMTVSV